MFDRDPGNSVSDTHWFRTTCNGITFHKSSIFAAASGVVHAFTAREGGCSEEPYGSLNMGFNVGDLPTNVEENHRRVAAPLGFSADNIASADQVHGRAVAVVTKPGRVVFSADALITNVPDVVLLLRFADCVPIYLFDPDAVAIGLVHSGWRGTAANVVGAAVEAMSEHFGTKSSRTLAAVGPCIGFKHYEVNRDVAEQIWLEGKYKEMELAQVVAPADKSGASYRLNLREAVRRQLVRAGVDDKSICVSEQCTFSNAKDFYSHRRDAIGEAKTGRMVAVMGLKQ